MRLPSQLLAKLTLAGLAVGAACEPAHKPECKSEPVVVEKATTPLDEVVRMTNEPPAVAPRFAQPQPPSPLPSQPQPEPQPTIKKKPKLRLVWESVCGHAQLVDEKSSTVKCGKG